MRKTKIVVLYGGKTAEHEVSLKTALTVINALDRMYYDIVPVYISRTGAWHRLEPVNGPVGEVEDLRVESSMVDPAASMGEVIQQVFAQASRTVAFPVIHGTHGEDGSLQGLLELLNVPYVGNGVLASAAGMDKEMTKRIMAAEMIPQAAYVSFSIHEWEQRASACCDKVEREIGFPCYVKPANLGSSIGIDRCENRDEWMKAMEDAFRYDNKVIVEQEIRGREVQVAVLGTDEPECSTAGEFEREPNFFNYEQKYMQGPLTQRIPARISADVYDRIRQMAIRAFQALCGSGLMRVDVFVTENDEIYFNEVNTFPGFTENSMFPTLWNRTIGLTYSELLNRLIRYALERHVRKQSLCYVPRMSAAAATTSGRIQSENPEVAGL